MKMNLIGALGLLVLAIVSANLSCTSTPGENREPSGFFGLNTSGAKKLNNEMINDAASAGPLKVESARVITDNDMAFKSKIDAIDSAKSGDTIRLIYYIYSNDESSSLFSSKLLAAAKRGVKIKMLLDFIDNYQHLDLFSFMEKESKGNIQVRLYGRPTPLIARDAYYMTIPCPPTSQAPTSTECASDKWNRINQKLAANSNAYDLAAQDTFSSMLLSGIYAKSGTPAKIAFFMGGQIDTGAQPKPSAEQKKQLQELGKLVFRAKFKKEASAYIQLATAISLYGAQINPVLDQVYGRMPLDQMGNTSSKMDWTHISDYTHHKLLLVENKSQGSFLLQLGGRNIENAYHMKINALSKSYTFMDTDFAAKITGGGEMVAAAYDKMWNFSDMAVGLSEIRTLMDNEFVANLEAFGESLQKCGALKNTNDAERTAVAQCLSKKLRESAKYKNLSARMEEQRSLMEKNQAVYLSSYGDPNKILEKNNLESWASGQGYKPVSQYEDQLPNQDLTTAQINLIENLQFNPKAPTATRVMGVTDGAELQSGKEIHHLLIKGLENTCAIATKENPKRVIFHTAYWLPPANVIRAFKKMMDGTWNCSNVKVTILTNSAETTDLGPINMVAQYQLKALLEAYAKSLRNQQKGLAQFEYFEYLRPKGADATKIRSLHTKLTLLGDDMIIGSANMDVRSYFMDTNNGVFIRNAHGLIKQYTQWIDSITADQAVSANLTGTYTSGEMTIDQLHNINNMRIDYLKATKGYMKSVKPEKVEQLKDLAKQLGTWAFEMTRDLVSEESFKHYFDEPNSIPRPETRVEHDRVEISKQFNELFQVL